MVEFMKGDFMARLLQAFTRWHWYTQADPTIRISHSARIASTPSMPSKQRLMRRLLQTSIQKYTAFLNPEGFLVSSNGFWPIHSPPLTANTLPYASGMSVGMAYQHSKQRLLPEKQCRKLGSSWLLLKILHRGRIPCHGGIAFSAMWKPLKDYRIGCWCCEIPSMGGGSWGFLWGR